MKLKIAASLLLTLVFQTSFAFDRQTWSERYHEQLTNNPQKALDMLEQRYLALPDSAEKLYLATRIHRFFLLRGQPYYADITANPTQYEEIQASLITALNSEKDGDFHASLTRLKELLTQSKNNSDYQARALFEYRLCFVLSRMGEHHSAKFYCSSAIAHLKELPESFIPMQDVYRLSAMNHAFLGNYKQALDEYQLAIGLSSVNEDKSGLYNDIGNLLVDMNEYDQAEKYLNLALASRISANAPGMLLAQVHHSLAALYLKMEALRLAEEHYDKAMSLLKDTEYNYGKAQVYIGLGRLYTELGNPNLSNAYLHRAMELASQMENRTMQVDIALSLSKTYQTNEVYPVAIEYAEQALNSAATEGLSNQASTASLILSQLYEQTGHPELALKHYKNYHQLEMEKHHAENRNAYEALDLNRTRLQEELEKSELVKDNQIKTAQISALSQSSTLYQLGVVALSLLLFVTYLFHRRSTRLAEYDSLTNTLSRIGTLKQIRSQKEPAEPGTNHVLALFDLDKFKQINDSFGHPTGDLALKHVAETINLNLENGEFIGRLGGEEFLVFMTNVREEDVTRRVEALRSAISSTSFMSEDNLSVSVTASFAFLSTQEGLHDFDVLYSILDQALYQAKMNGRDCIVDAYRDPVDVMPYSASRAVTA